MQEQPKVVDQMVAEMAPQQMPEDQGIGQLPAGDMNFANGGIIAFADGGDVERYQFGGSLSGDFSGFGGSTPEQAAADELRVAEEARIKQIAALEQKAAFLKSAGAPQAVEAQAQLDVLKNSMRPKPSPTDPNFRRQTDPRFLGTPAVPSTTPLITSGPAPTPNTKLAVPGTKPPAPAEDKSDSGLDALVNKFTRSADLAIGDQRNARAGLVAQLEQEATGTKQEGEARRLARGDVFAKKEARLAEREKGVAGMKDQNLGLALLQAGATMMTTPGNLGSVIGKGVQVGSERYVAGIDKINAAKDKFAEARDRLDDLRINRDDMNEKEVRDENRAIRTARIQGQQLLLDGAGKDLEISNANQKAIFGVAAENILADKKIKSAENIAAISERRADARANAYTPDMREAMLLGTGSTPEEKYLSGLKVKKDLMGDKQGTQLFKMFLEENGRREKNMEQPLTLDQFRRQSAAFFAPPNPVDTGKPTRP
jgi:hypothetical protein